MATMEVTKKPNGSAEALVPRTPFELMSQAITQGISAEQLQILQDMHFKSLDRQAEVEFNEALNRVQTQIPMVAPDLTNPQTNSKYASFAAIDKKVRPIYAAEGFSLSFNTADCPKPDHVRVLAYLSRGKHTRTYQIDMPVTTTGIQGKAMMTLTHASASANTYGKRYLLCDIFNIPVGTDADGNTFNGLTGALEKISGAKDKASLETVFKAAYKEAFEAKADSAMKSLVAAKDKRKKELNASVEQHGVPVEF